MSNWTSKDIAEIIGITAIVLSLVFVGLQMKQSQEIAIAETYQQEISATYAGGSLAAANAEAVAKANRGAELSEAEVFALREYVRTRWLHAFFSSSHQLFLGGNTGGPVGNTSMCLCANPGLKKIWKEQFENIQQGAGPNSRLADFLIELDASVTSRCGV